MNLLTLRITVQRLVVGVWALWYTTIVCSNATNILQVWGILPESFKWVSHNYAMFVDGSGVEGPARHFVVALFLGGYLWEVATVSLLWRALVRGFSAPDQQAALARPAFTLGIGFWGVFMVLSEVTVRQTPTLYLELFLAQIASLLLVELVPDRHPPRPDRIEGPEPSEHRDRNG